MAADEATRRETVGALSPISSIKTRCRAIILLFASFIKEMVIDSKKNNALI
jgi:hypothetical protein